jgi:hypothetical protein
MPGRQPAVQHQGPAGHCVIHGHDVSWTSCTCYAMAMAIDGVRTGTSGVPTGCTVRLLTDDVIGGTTIPQVCAAAHHMGYQFEQYVGGNAAKTDRIIGELYHGRRLVCQGNTSATLHTPFRSTTGPINHAVEADEGRGWHRNAAGLLIPTEVLVFDPAADHRRPEIADSPDWWPYSLLVAFGAALRPWGDDDPRTLGGGHMYVAVSPPPEIRLAYGGRRTILQPDQLTIKTAAGRSANIRKRPDRLRAIDVVDRMPNGAKFMAYQITHGAAPHGSNSVVWYGDWTGTRWVHSSNVTGQGGDR